MKNLVCWLFGDKPMGLGTLLFGIAACAALWQTSTLLEKILLIQEQSKAIRQGVDELKQGVAVLQAQIKEATASKAVESLSALQKKNPSRKEIERMLSPIPGKAIGGHSGVILPTSQREKAIDMLLNASSPVERMAVLQDYLEYIPVVTTDKPCTSGDCYQK